MLNTRSMPAFLATWQPSFMSKASTAFLQLLHVILLHSLPQRDFCWLELKNIFLRRRDLNPQPSNLIHKLRIRPQTKFIFSMIQWCTILFFFPSKQRWIVKLFWHHLRTKLFFKTLALLRRASFWPPSLVYISVINTQTLQSTFLHEQSSKLFSQKDFRPCRDFEPWTFPIPSPYATNWAILAWIQTFTCFKSAFDSL